MLIYKGIRLVGRIIRGYWHRLRTYIVLKGNSVKFSSFRTNGVPYVMVARGGSMSIGPFFSMNNGIEGNPIGCYDRCTFFVDRGATLTIGQRVGISQSALVAVADITVEDDVKIGGGVRIYTSDFHSLDPDIRRTAADMKNRKSASVVIKENAFIGARSIILKGVTIGKNSIVGAGSVVTKSIPDNQIWAGNPAVFIKNV